MRAMGKGLMQYRTMCLIGITSLLGSIWCGKSESANTGSGVFKLEEVIELVLKRNPGMGAAKGEVQQSQRERVVAGAFLNPSINGSGGRGTIRSGDPRVSYRAKRQSSNPVC